jgi:hypothetical protein
LRAAAVQAGVDPPEGAFAGPADGPAIVETVKAQGLATSRPDRVPVAGRPRSFWASVGLGALTLTLYFWYWQWQVFREVHRQERTRPMAEVLMAALLFSLAGGVLSLLATREGGAGYARWAAGATLAGVVIQTGYLVLETRGLDRLLRARDLVGTSASGWLVAFGVLGAVMQLATTPGPGQTAVGLLGVAVGLVGFYLLQNGLNRYWAHERSSAPVAAPTALSATPS